jgi:hypothetical protein
MTRPSLRKFSPISVKLGSQSQTVSTVMEIAKLILDERWPLLSGSAQSTLRMAIVTCFNDEMTPKQVRDRFIGGANEAHVEIVELAPLKPRAVRQPRVLPGRSRSASISRGGRLQKMGE